MSIDLSLDTKVAALESVSDNSYSDKAVDLLKAGLKSDLNAFGEVSKRDIATQDQVDMRTPTDLLISSSVFNATRFNPTLVGSGTLLIETSSGLSTAWSSDILTLTTTPLRTASSDTITIPATGNNLLFSVTLNPFPVNLYGDGLNPFFRWMEPD